MKMRAGHGFVLLSLLVWLQIFLLLNWYGLQGVWLQNKRNIASWEQMQTTVLAKQQLSAILRMLRAPLPVTCFIPVTNLSTLTHQTLSWWELHGCRGTHKEVNQSYFYVLEALGVDGCAKITNPLQRDLIANYYRVTLYSPPRHLLQASIVVASNSQPVPCQYHEHEVQQGLQTVVEW